MFLIFLGLSLLSNVKGVGYERFSLCCFSSAFIKGQASNVNTQPTPKEVPNAVFPVPKRAQERIESVNSK